ncbi:MAG TPA: bifunctional hydroxymethylpyrimidine kinase/phosphomethylpyrimidine kinase [Candidatus Copromorpha excrementigallinarum]|uniref:Bifunctional hydroxymethylpyrimidine kinase/phosphomethylpyrimidine kinase n=1 Tax=Candidatus Allocopromorpha excrementigallinarum TaxID=2840742 RepID=A0A9D1I2M5_9FIRM|nr:bifunctional hydroxymethylpyrimidine kinase/phosphomethylpyrimidine kinase [Candidatus Copromorpha excrementigallinarum]
MITVIGGVEISIKVKTLVPEKGEGKKEGTVNEIKTVCGGGGFNIAGNLAASGQEAALISAVGKDILGRAALEELKEAGVDTRGVAVLSGVTPVKTEILNILGDAEFTGEDKGLLQRITPEVIDAGRELIAASDIVVIDGKIPADSIRYAAELCEKEEGKRIFFDPGSVEGSGRAAELTGSFHGVMPGRMEAEAMTGGSILSEDQLMEAGSLLTGRGVSKIIITMKGGGLYYKEGMTEGILRPERVLSFADTSGAGDVVSAAVAEGAALGLDIEETAKRAMKRAADFLAALEDKKPI